MNINCMFPTATNLKRMEEWRDRDWTELLQGSKI